MISGMHEHLSEFGKSSVEQLAPFVVEGRRQKSANGLSAIGINLCRRRCYYMLIEFNRWLHGRNQPPELSLVLRAPRHELFKHVKDFVAGIHLLRKAMGKPPVLHLVYNHPHETSAGTCVDLRGLKLWFE